MSDDDFLGTCDFGVDGLALKSGSPVESWLDLTGVESGRVRIRLAWHPVSVDPRDYEDSVGCGEAGSSRYTCHSKSKVNNEYRFCYSLPAITCIYAMKTVYIILTVTHKMKQKISKK